MSITRITCVADDCGTFPMDEALVQQLKRTGETFTCPAGHEQHFTDSPESRLKRRIEKLEARAEELAEERDAAQRRLESFEEQADRWYDEAQTEKERRKFAESRLLDYATGVVEVADGGYKWSCQCGARGQKLFEEVDAAQVAYERHQRSQCSVDHGPEVTVDVRE
ncbi:hypothetical protein [Haloarcula sp. JP-L23]|uniref:hypothetical protein n=1 Tax=Haloarcula sp. JP-L23 TaxID=2716717 RepID=UPI00140EBA57|nr:hypothetical protein G9465_24785 [Haloarcula sp. JP-L23]